MRDYEEISKVYTEEILKDLVNRSIAGKNFFNKFYRRRYLTI